MWIEFVLVKFSIWGACALWFVGSLARGIASSVSGDGQRSSSWEHLYRWAWLAAGLATWTHVLASYGLVHGWSHDSVLNQTGDESYAVVGFRVPWGVYANFLFASLLLGYSLFMIMSGNRWGRLDPSVYYFLGFIVFNAMVVFKTGPIRWSGVVAFLTLLGACIYQTQKHRAPHSQGSESGC